MSEPQVRILLADDHLVVRLGVVSLLESVPNFTVVGEAGSAAQAVEEAKRCRPDVVIMDVRLPDRSGTEACRIIRSELPDTRVIMLSSYADEDEIIAAIVSGASGYLLKEVDREQFVDAIWLVARGGSLLGHGVTDTVMRYVRSGRSAPQDPLEAVTAQERQILHLIADGKTNREIASVLFVSEHSVKIYVSTLLRKLNLSRRSEAAAFIARREQLRA